MTEKKFSYYQFRKALGHEVFLRFEDGDFENLFSETLDIMGFEKVERDTIKGHTFYRNQTRVLRVIKATPKVGRQIKQGDFLGDRFGVESFSQMGSYDVYRYRGVGMMISGEHHFLWELGIKSTRNQEAIRTILTRFLSLALAPMGVVGFWGVPIEEGFVVLNPQAANFESIFVDVKNNVLVTYDGVKDLDVDLQILRLDATLRNEMRQMKSEQLLSFLSIHTIHLSYTGLDYALKDAIFELTQIATGFVYPSENFKPRMANANKEAA